MTTKRTVTLTQADGIRWLMVKILIFKGGDVDLKSSRWKRGHEEKAEGQGWAGGQGPSGLLCGREVPS